MEGKTIRKMIRQDLTYHELDATIDHLWSVLFTTGYLTYRGKASGGYYELAIPNREVQRIFEVQIQEWFQETALQDKPRLERFCDAFKKGDADEIEGLFNAYLLKSISIRDTFAQKRRRESFYHGILLGLLSFREDWSMFSNAETGAGYCDILIEIEDEQTGIIIETKYADNGDMEAGCEAAIRQICERDYTERLQRDGMKQILIYGISCFQKRCKVRVDRIL